VVDAVNIDFGTELRFWCHCFPWQDRILDPKRAFRLEIPPRKWGGVDVGTRVRIVSMPEDVELFDLSVLQMENPTLFVTGQIMGYQFAYHLALNGDPLGGGGTDANGDGMVISHSNGEILTSQTAVLQVSYTCCSGIFEQFLPEKSRWSPRAVEIFLSFNEPAVCRYVETMRAMSA